jgi:hypothetical protein
MYSGIADNVTFRASSREAVRLQLVDAIASDSEGLTEDGVDGSREACGGFGGAAGRDLAALEDGRVVAGDRASI